MFAPQSLTDFPSLGDLSIGRYSVPLNSGTTPVTELRNILDTRWSMDSLDRAVDLARGSTSGFSSGCLAGNGLWNPDGSAFGFGGRSGLSLTGLGSVLGRGADSLLGTIGDLQIANTLQDVLQPKGVAVVIEAVHQCMTTRGVHHRHVSTITTRFTGAFKDDPALAERFLKLARG